jgi:large subunit ribosomal protein L5
MAKEKEKKQRKGASAGGGGAQVKDSEAVNTTNDLPPARLRLAYNEKVVSQLQEKFGHKNKLAVPKLDKIVISMGLGKAVTGGEKGKLDTAEKELTVIAGQKPVRCKAKKAVSNFKVREGMETGLKVTLRGDRMYEFLDRVITLAIPRVKDFRGLNPNAFDKEGNYNFGFTEQTVFPEIDGGAVTFQQGMNVTIVTTAKDVNQGRELLSQMGFPFRVPEKKE